MCMLMTGASSAIRSTLLNTAGLIESLYDHNSDGLGVMYAAKARLKVTKHLPKSATAVRTIIQKLPNDARHVVLHFRYKTHGDIDLTNCHPYPINATSALAHNGILHTGNSADRSKSDTWHFVKDYLATMTDDMLHDTGMLKMMGDFIEDNRFAIMSADGRVSVVNRDQGVECRGVWFSNLYAWDPALLMPQYARPKYKSAFKTQTYDWSKSIWAKDSEYELADEIEDETVFTHGGLVSALDAEAMIDSAIENYDNEALATALLSDPETSVGYILNWYKVTPYAKYDPLDHTQRHNRMVDSWTEGKETALIDAASMDADAVAEALLFSCDVEACEYV